MVRSVTLFLDKCSFVQASMSLSLTFTKRSLKLNVLVTDSFTTFGYNGIIRAKGVMPYSYHDEKRVFRITNQPGLVVDPAYPPTYLIVTEQGEVRFSTPEEGNDVYQLGSPVLCSNINTLV